MYKATNESYINMFKKYELRELKNINWKYKYSIEKMNIFTGCFRALRMIKSSDGPINQCNDHRFSSHLFLLSNTKDCKIQFLKNTKWHSIEKS